MTGIYKLTRPLNDTQKLRCEVVPKLPQQLFTLPVIGQNAFYKSVEVMAMVFAAYMCKLMDNDVVYGGVGIAHEPP